jgi:cytochrome c553
MRSIRPMFAAVWRRGSQIGQQQIRCRTDCHGAHAEWLSVFPRLAGYRAPYLLQRMLVIQKVMRPVPAMRGRSDR